MFKFITRTPEPLILLAGLVCLYLYAAPEQAPLAGTSVQAATGNVANDCDWASVCRASQLAHGNTFDRGEASILDAGGYGGATVTKSICILHDGVGEAAAAGDEMIRRAYSGVVVESSGDNDMAGSRDGSAGLAATVRN
jgi:hypothetical protein